MIIGETRKSPETYNITDDKGNIIGTKKLLVTEKLVKEYTLPDGSLVRKYDRINIEEI